MSNTVFKKYAKYYDLLYKEKDYAKEIAFILKALKRGGFSGKKILSLGCGTCTYEILLAKKGYSITGVDVSEEMLKVAKEKISAIGLTDKIRLIKADVRKLKLKEKYDMVMCMFNVIGYQNSNDDMRETLRGVSSLLKKNGAFFFDCWHMPAVILDKPQKRERKMEVKGETVIRKTTPTLFPQKDLLQIRFEVKDYKGKKLTGSANETHTMRYFTLPELDYFLEMSGMNMKKAYNFPDINSKVGTDKWDIFVVAGKK